LSTSVAGNGSGPDGSSLTADYQRSPGSGAEKVSGQLTLGEVGNPSGLALLDTQCVESAALPCAARKM